VKTSIYILISIIVLMVVAIAMAWSYPMLKAKATPLVICSVILVLSAVQLVYEVRGGKKQTSIEDSMTADSAETSIRSYFREFAWAIGFVVSTFLVGFLITIPLFDILYLKSHGSKWRVIVPITVLMTTICWAIFSWLLKADLYPGLIITLLGG
jgi:hypothetical protein